MLEKLNNFPHLKQVYDGLTARFADSIEKSSFEKDELAIQVKKDKLLEIVNELFQKHGFNALNDIIGVDNLKTRQEGDKRFSILYQLYRFPEVLRIRIQIQVEEDEAAPSICAIIPAANWAEREIFDMFGIFFSNHPDLKRIYMPDTWKDYPLRKDYPLEGES